MTTTARSEFHARALVYVAGPYTKPDPCITTHWLRERWPLEATTR